MDDIAGFEIGLEFAIVAAVLTGVGTAGDMAAIDVEAAQVTRHERQAWHAIARHVQVVAQLPGFFAGAVEVGILDGIGQEHRAACAAGIAEPQVVEWLITPHLLVSQGEGVC
ncbi:hypothetical protein D3C80_1603740 [compost metagenome]